MNKDGSTSYVCQVKAGHDPATGKQRVLTGTAKSERAAHKLVHELVTNAASDQVLAQTPLSTSSSTGGSST